jgi:hypothetical protein
MSWRDGLFSAGRPVILMVYPGGRVLSWFEDGHASPTEGADGVESAVPAWIALNDERAGENR